VQPTSCPTAIDIPESRSAIGENVVRDPEKEPSRVRSMFDGIAGRYDLLNHLLSLNLDRRWRRAAARELPELGQGVILDLCGGTGDLSIAAEGSGRAETVICCDFSHEMLARANVKFRQRGVDGSCLVLEADGLNLPFPDGTFDAVTVGFGVRNFVDLDAGLGEIHRVLRPGGRLIVLEFSRPTRAPLAPLYRFYLKRILPRLGDGVHGARGPYGYLARTIAAFDDPETLADRIRDAGFPTCDWSPMTGGIVASHTAIKASR